MKCSRCGSVTVVKNGDWYKCLECGNIMFDTHLKKGSKTAESPTLTIKQIEDTEQKNTAPPMKHSRASGKADKHNNNKPRVKEVSEKDMNKKTRNRKEVKSKSKIRDIADCMFPIVLAVVIAILLKTFVFANVVVPSGSMANTIQEKDRIIASRLSYINNAPQRYDIVIFHYPDDESQYFVKRIIGLPGETVTIDNGVVYITQPNGETAKLRSDFVTNCTPKGSYGPYTVPENSYFMMGDNRNDSLDSRFWENKFVAEDKIIGKVKFRYSPSLSKIE